MHFVLLILLKFRVHPKVGLVLLSGGRQIVVEYNRWTGPSFFHLYKQL
eukprot:COSAG02_NODE_71374_length_191_cov_36.532609_1_plen_47_part_01